jgi:hypothetical protein
MRSKEQNHKSQTRISRMKTDELDHRDAVCRSSCSRLRTSRAVGGEDLLDCHTADPLNPRNPR